MRCFGYGNRPLGEPTVSSKIAQLPPELLAKVFESIPYYPSHARRKTLASLCRVSRYFNEVGKPILYSSVHLHLASKDGQQPRLVDTIIERSSCAKLIKSLRVSARDAKSVDWIVLQYVLSHLELDVLKVSGFSVKPVVTAVIKYQRKLKKLVLPDIILKENWFGRLFPALPHLKVFEGRIHVADPWEREFDNDEWDRADPIDEEEEETAEESQEVKEEGEEEEDELDETPPTFQLKELYLGWGPRQNAFNYIVQSSLTSLTHLTLAMNDWRATMDLSRLVSLESLVIVTNSNHGAVFDISTGCLPALAECIKSIKDLKLRSLSIQGSLSWVQSIPYANDILESLPTSLEELDIGFFNAHRFTPSSLLPHIPRLTNFRRLVLAANILPSSVSIEKRKFAIIPCATFAAFGRRHNQFLDSTSMIPELDPLGNGSEFDSDGEEEDEEEEEEYETDSQRTTFEQGVDYGDEDSEEDSEWYNEDGLEESDPY
ncbi:uncharacterized protein JCM6883_006622 [Sporobolomyces salmoneus]|uniref:uncharacterized protein n=1 Tax=Sporobolomyces salmoneus TaxID=183962 RepID=UPI00317337B5